MLDKQFFRFLLIGAVNTVFGYSAFSLFIFLGFHYAIASLLATIVGVLFNFMTTGRYVFNNRENSLIGKFFLVYGIVYVCNVGLLKIMDAYSIDMYVAGALILLPMALLSYVLNKKFVFEVKK
ncbi:MAG: GtrA family protein [Firmicutes bacterium]|nr:GtrA family protein [Bacillota bacterium]